ncbi:hypothetical protein CONLIGDRAFT_484401 [Coniochaeta ligniaria NRRL 30616]|uniref:Uncharacterized protein n=1 Tax=Coniochaeta ligniaria NRRL 30616 TaxID=1408157 RepID=A0A1J7JBY7_9PEZI|nr:hypothetical protein CONLIGDRAFT_484401 [Coniochaeta ligniaria NRRL 30616]
MVLLAKTSTRAFTSSSSSPQSAARPICMFLTSPPPPPAKRKYSRTLLPSSVGCYRPATSSWKVRCLPYSKIHPSYPLRLPPSFRGRRDFHFLFLSRIYSTLEP